MKQILSIIFFGLTLISFAYSQLDERVLKSNRLFADKNWEQVAPIYDDILKDSLRNTKLFAKAFLAAAELNDSVRIKNYFESCIVGNAFSIDTLLNGLNMECIKTGNFQAIYKLSGYFSVLDPSLEMLLYRNQLKFYSLTKQPELLMIIVDKMLKLNPKNVELMGFKANAYELDGKYEDALLMYRRVLEIDANNFDANVFMGNYYYLNGISLLNQNDSEYKTLVEPTRMQYADYMNKQLAVFSSDFAKSERFLEVAMRIKDNPGILSVLNSIKTRKAALMKNMPNR